MPVSHKLFQTKFCHNRMSTVAPAFRHAALPYQLLVPPSCQITFLSPPYLPATASPMHPFPFFPPPSLFSNFGSFFFISLTSLSLPPSCAVSKEKGKGKKRGPSTHFFFSFFLSLPLPSKLRTEELREEERK